MQNSSRNNDALHIYTFYFFLFFGWFYSIWSVERVPSLFAISYVRLATIAIILNNAVVWTPRVPKSRSATVGKHHCLSPLSQCPIYNGRKECPLAFIWPHHIHPTFSPQTISIEITIHSTFISDMNCANRGVFSSVDSSCCSCIFFYLLERSQSPGKEYM